MKVFIEGRRSGYSPDEASTGATMTVRELIERLQELDEDAKVFLCNDNGYTYGNITSWTIHEEEDEEEYEE